jgi:hypothetical protein
VHCGETLCVVVKHRTAHYGETLRCGETPRCGETLHCDEKLHYGETLHCGEALHCDGTLCTVVRHCALPFVHCALSLNSLLR